MQMHQRTQVRWPVLLLVILALASAGGRAKSFLRSTWAAVAPQQAAAAEVPGIETKADEPQSEVKPRPSGGQGGGQGVFAEGKLEVGDKKREYRLIVPKSVDLTKPTPLVFAFHGLFDSKNLMPMYSQLDKLAEEKGFILVFPNGLNRHWSIIPALAKDDIAFFDALYARLTAEYNVDLNRVYLTGMSNGAYFSNLIASQRTEIIAAIATHSGGIGFVAAKPPEGKHKYPVLVVHGVDDSIVNIDEGRKQRDLYLKWGHKVEYVEVPGHNHFWAHKVDVNHKIWDFFVAHPKR